MVSEAALKVIKKACIIKIERGEDGYEVVAQYTKLSEAQAKKMIQELIDEGYLV